jgi:uncharacterized membrane protein
MPKRKFFFPIIFIIASAVLIGTLYGSRVSVPQLSVNQRLPGFPPDSFYRGIVTSLSQKNIAGSVDAVWDAGIELLGGDEKGKIVSIEVRQSQLPLRVGERVVVNKVSTLGDIEYGIYDHYRIQPILWIAALFLIFVVAIARLKGVGSVVGLVFSILVLLWYTIPRILIGHDPIFISITGAILIAFFSLYAAHGLNRKTSIALMSTIITLGISAGISFVFIIISKLNGMGSEDAFYLQMSGLETINLKGLLLGGIIIGMLGILDDVTTGQVAAVGEIKDVDPNLSLRELYRRGMSVGREHIASLVNTLVLAYAGASLPVFLLFIINPNEQPLWVILNSEFIAEEMIRTLAGSFSLVLAVPIATFLAAYFLRKRPV